VTKLAAEKESLQQHANLSGTQSRMRSNRAKKGLKKFGKKMLAAFNLKLEKEEEMK